MSSAEGTSGAGARRLLLVRHGQTPANVALRLDCLPPGPELTDLGRQQAAGLAQSLPQRFGDIRCVHASVATRAQQTAAPLAATLGLAVHVIEGAHEVQVGVLEGLNSAEAHEQFGSTFRRWLAGGLDTTMPEGESGTAVTRRLRTVTAEIDAGLGAGSAVLVSHGASLRLLANMLADNIDSEFAGAHILPNTGVIVLRSEADSATGWRCAEWAGVVPEEVASG